MRAHLDSFLAADPVRRTHPLARGLVAWWRAVPRRAAGPTWHDLLGRHPGTLSGPTWAATARPGGAGELRYAAGNVVTVASSAAFDLSAFDPTVGLSLACWVRPTDYSAYRGLVTRTSGATPAPWDWYLAATSGLPTFFGFSATVGPTAPAAGAWSHLAVTYVAGVGTAHYLDGRPNGGVDAANGPTSAANVPVLIGNRGDAFTTFAGALDDAMIWSRGLTDAEVRALHVESRAGHPGLLGSAGPAPVGVAAAAGCPAARGARSTVQVARGMY